MTVGCTSLVSSWTSRRLGDGKWKKLFLRRVSLRNLFLFIFKSTHTFYLNSGLIGCLSLSSEKITEIAKGRMADKGRTGERRKKRVIRPPPSLIDEEEVLEAVPALKRTRVAPASVSVAVAGSTSQIPEAVPSRVAAEKAPGVSRDDVEIVDSGENLPEDISSDVLEQDTGISLNYFRSPPVLGSGSQSNPINPETGVQYLCAHGKDLIRSEEIFGYGKMSNVDRIRHGQAHMAGNVSRNL